MGPTQEVLTRLIFIDHCLRNKSICEPKIPQIGFTSFLHIIPLIKYNGRGKDLSYLVFHLYLVSQEPHILPLLLRYSN